MPESTTPLMNFSPTEEQLSLCDQTKRFAENLLGKDLAARDSKGEFSRDEWDACVQQGIFGLNVPTQLGGAGHDVLTSALMLEALGYGCPDNGLTLAINGQVWCVQAPIMEFGSDFQRDKYVKGMVDGSMIGAHAMTEAESGSNAFGMKTTAEKTDGGYILNGCKIYVGMAPVADCILAFVSTDPKRGRWGISTFIVDGNAPGVTLHPARQKMGLRTVPTGSIEFHNAFVPDENLVGKPGSGASIFSASMDYERSLIFTSHVGSMARQLDSTIEFAKTRQQLGHSIGKFQSISNRIADMKLRLETSRMLLHRCAALIDQGKKIPMEAAMANLHIAESFMQNSLASVRIHGGRGYMSEFEVERDMRDAVGGLIYSGTSDIQRNLIAGLLGL